MRLAKKPWKAPARCTAASVVCPENACLIEAQHHTYLPNERVETDPASRVHELKTGAGSAFIHPVVCLVHNLGNMTFVATAGRRGQMKTTLP